MCCLRLSRDCGKSRKECQCIYTKAHRTRLEFSSLPPPHLSISLSFLQLAATCETVLIQHYLEVFLSEFNSLLHNERDNGKNAAHTHTHLFFLFPSECIMITRGLKFTPIFADSHIICVWYTKRLYTGVAFGINAHTYICLVNHKSLYDD